MRAFARHVLERILRRFEYRLADVLEDPIGLAGACARLKSHGFQPRTVIDVGVGPGTPWLYSAFPSAKFVLFEPLETFRPSIERATEGLDADIHFCAIGEQRATMTIQVNADHPTSSSMARYDRTYTDANASSGGRPTLVNKEVEVRTLDDFGPFASPTLLKLDVEGFEDAVLRGAHTSLKNVDIIISEVSVLRRTERELSFGNFILFLEDLGFSAVNIAEITAMGRGGPIAYMDMVFARSDSAMRYR